MTWARRLAIGLMMASTCAAPAFAQSAAAPEAATGRSDKSAVLGPHAVVASANPVASRAGAEMLAAGGTVADAAVAMQLVLTLVEPQSSGLGGGAFALHWDAKTRRLVTYDGRETAPGGAKPDMFLGADGRPIAFADGVLGGIATGVPGTPRLIAALHKAHGRLPWAKVFEPAIRLAENGFIVSPRLAGLLADEKALPNDPAARAYFYHPDGSPYRAGETLKNPELAATLRLLQTKGADAFYRGEIAQAILMAVSRPPRPSTMTQADLDGYRLFIREPVCAPYRQLKVCGMGPPSSGGVAVAQMLGLLSGFGLSSMTANGLPWAHLFTQAQRLAFADRNRYLADPGFVPQPVTGLLDRAYLRQRAGLIDPQRDMGPAQPGTPPGRRLAMADDAAPERPATSHLIVADQYGNALSMTTTVESAFGSRRMVKGFLLNNEMTDFSFLPEQDGRPVANRVEAGKRPRSSMAPTIAFDRAGKPALLAGSPGGFQIIGYVAQTLLGAVDGRLDPQTAVSAGHYGNANGPTQLEKGTEAVKLEDGLKAMGHANIQIVDMTSGLSLAVRTKQGWLAGVDPRREGLAIGF